MNRDRISSGCYLVFRYGMKTGHNSTPSIRGGAVLAFGWIGDQENLNAIERALQIDTSPQAKADFEYAMKTIHR